MSHRAERDGRSPGTTGTEATTRLELPASLPRTARVIFGAAVAVLAAHIVTSAALAPNPGTTPKDHLLSALVPLTLLALAMALFARLRSGWQTAVALVLGAITLVGGGVALQGLRQGIGGSDWTGILLVPSGLALVGLGIWLLSRGRRSGGHRLLRVALTVAAFVLGAYVLVLPISMAIVATHRPAKPVPTAREAALGRPARDVSVRTADGLTLHGWYVPSRNGAAVLCLPREWTSPQARLLVKRGYGVLLLDLRGYGDSEGDPNAFGWGSSVDVEAGVKFLARQPDVKDGRIGGIGLSVGAEQLIEAAARGTALRAVVSDGAGERSVRESLVRGVRGWPAVPSMAVETAAVTVLSGHRPPPSLRDLVARIAPRPLLLIYAENGGGGEELTPQYFAAARAPKQLWLVRGAGHTGGLSARPADYERRVVAFFDHALLGGD